MKNILTRKIHFSLMLSLCLLFTACSQKDEGKRIVELIDKGAALVEKKDLQGLTKLLCDDFQAEYGKYDKMSIKEILWYAYRRYGAFTIAYPEPDIQVESSKEWASADMILLILKKNKIIPGLKALYNDPSAWLDTVGENADLYRLDLELRKTKGTWYIKGAYLEGFTGYGFE